MTHVPLAARLRWLLRRAGWPALAGLALLAGAGAMKFALVAPAEAQLAELRTKIAKARRIRTEAGAPTADAAAMLAALPRRDALEGIVAAIHEAAAAEAIATAAAEYRARREGGFVRYEIGLPVKAAWEPLRRWLGAVVERQPALALDELSLRRDHAENATLDGRVQLTVFLRHHGEPPAEGVALPPRRHAVDSSPLFAARSWQPPPPPPPPPAAPSAPPLPFKYAGKIIEGSRIRVFLTQGSATTLAAEGDRIGHYDVERVSATSAVFLYRPLQQKQTLNFGGYVD